jgi:membrane associated rhomboid family serine protease
LTYSLLHAGTAHLIINITLQLFIALPLETEVGHINTLYVYIGGVLSGSIAASFTNDGLLMVGASSGIYSLLMSHISHILMVFFYNFKKCILQIEIFFQNHEIIVYKTHRVVAIVVLTLSDIIHSISHCLLNNNEEPRIHIAAHVAGAFSGILLGFIFYHQQNSKKDFIYAKWISIGLFMTFILVVIAINFNKI